MDRPKPVAQDLLADLPVDADAKPTQSMPPPKPKRTKKAQPKAKATVVETEDALPISQLAGSKKTVSIPIKRSVETQPAESSKSKKARSSSATASGSKKPDVLWAPKITLENRPIMSSESADDINVGVALSTTLLLLGDLNRERMTEMKKEFSALQKTNKGLQLKMKKLEEQAEAATKAQQIAEEKAESAEAIRKVAEAEKIEAEDRKAQAEKELQEALTTKDVEIKEADEKAYAQGMANVTEEYKLQKLDLLADSPFRNADAIPLPFPPPPPPPPSPSQPEEASESEDEDGGEDEDGVEILVRKPKDAAGTKSLPSSSQIMDLTQDDVGEGVAKETTPEHASSDVPQIDKSIDETLAEIDAELAMEKAVEVALQESAEVQTKVAPEAEEPQL
ncbi:uncharacterized abhydrolase domain-containing protein DDB_G0269086-like [Camellia sinensis]|uniref:uncharacterized abhydrolase domain-containing protein DDB_G0269086-like n=1 Tax=Camellia sinensis TaxID=4442 RepID=UPI00103597EE|nr:uncharacterized abhydrolase domain-containing protein DDB_G0269086-like [Camellia sinensis]